MMFFLISPSFAYETPEISLQLVRRHYLDYNSSRTCSWLFDADLSDNNGIIEKVLIKGPGFPTEGGHMIYLPSRGEWSERFKQAQWDNSSDILALDTDNDHNLEYYFEVSYLDGGFATYQGSLSILDIETIDLDSALNAISIQRDEVELVKNLSECGDINKLILHPFENNSYSIDWSHADDFVPVEVSSVRETMATWISFDESGLGKFFKNKLTETYIQQHSSGSLDFNLLYDFSGNQVSWQDLPVAKGSIKLMLDSLDNPQIAGQLCLGIYPDVAVSPYQEMIRYFNSKPDGSSYDGYTLQKRLHIHSPLLKGPLDITSVEAFLDGEKITSIRNYSQEELAENYPFREYGDAVKDGIRFRVYDTDNLVEMDGLKIFEYVICYQDGRSRTITRDFDFSENTERYPRNISISYQETNGEIEPLTPLLPESLEKVFFDWDKCLEGDRYGDAFCKVDVEKNDMWFGGMDDLIDSGGGCCDWFITDGTVSSSDIWDTPEEMSGWQRGDISLVHEYENNTRYVARFPVATSLEPFPRKVRISDVDYPDMGSDIFNIRVYVDYPFPGIDIENVQFYVTCPELGIVSEELESIREYSWGRKYQHLFSIDPDSVYGRTLNLHIDSSQNNSWDYVFDLTSISQRPSIDFLEYSYSLDGTNWNELTVSRDFNGDQTFLENVPNSKDLLFRVYYPSPNSEHAASQTDFYCYSWELNYFYFETYEKIMLNGDRWESIWNLPTEKVLNYDIESFVKLWEDEDQNNYFAYNPKIKARTQIYDEGICLKFLNLVENRYYSWEENPSQTDQWNVEFNIEQDDPQRVFLDSSITSPWSEILQEGDSWRSVPLTLTPSDGNVYPVHFYTDLDNIGPGDQGIYDLHCYESNLNGIEMHTYYSIDPYIAPEEVAERGIEFTGMSIPSDARYLAVEISNLPSEWCFGNNLHSSCIGGQYLVDGGNWELIDDSCRLIFRPEEENSRHLAVFDLQQLPENWSQLSFSQGTGSKSELYQLINHYIFRKGDSLPLPINNYGLTRIREIPLRGEPYYYWILRGIDVSSGDEYIDSIKIEGPGIEQGVNDNLNFFSDIPYWDLYDLPTWETADSLKSSADPDGFLRYILKLKMKDGTARQGLVEVDVSSIQDDDYDPYLDMISVIREGVELNRNVNSLEGSNVQILDPTNMTNDFYLNWGDAVSGSGLDFWRIRGRLWSSICLPSGRHERLQNSISGLSQNSYTLNMNTGALRSDPQIIADWRDWFIRSGYVQVFLSDSLKPWVSATINVQIMPDFITSGCQIVHAKIYRDSGDHLSFGSPSIEKGFIIDGNAEQSDIPGKTITNVETTIAGLPLTNTGSGNNWHFETESPLVGDSQLVESTVYYQDGTSRTMSYDFNTTTDESLFADICEIQYKLDNQDQYQDIIPRIQKDVSSFSYSFEEKDISPTGSEAFACTNDSFTTISAFEDVDGDTTELTSSQVWSDHGFDRSNWESEKLGVSCNYFNSFIYSTVYEVLPPFNQSPYISATISPFGGASGVSIYPELSWSASDHEGLDLTHKLYFGSSSTLDENDLIYTTTVPSGTTVNYDTLHLQPDSTYYWKVTVSDGENEIVSSIFSFSTVDEELLYEADCTNSSGDGLISTDIWAYSLGDTGYVDKPLELLNYDFGICHGSEIYESTVSSLSDEVLEDILFENEPLADSFQFFEYEFKTSQISGFNELLAAPAELSFCLNSETVGQECIDAISSDYAASGDLAIAIFRNIRIYAVTSDDLGQTQFIDLAALAEPEITDEEQLIRFFDVWEEPSGEGYFLTVPLVVVDEAYPSNPLQTVDNDFESYFILFDGEKNQSFEGILVLANFINKSGPGNTILRLYPEEITVGIGQSFDLVLYLDTGEEEVNGISAFLDFDPSLMKVGEIDMGDSFDLPLPKSYDNLLGHVDINVGTVTQPYPSGHIMISTIHCAALDTVSSTDITFSFDNNPLNYRKTEVSREGDQLLGYVKGSSVTITECILSGQVSYQGRSQGEKWSLPLVVQVKSAEGQLGTLEVTTDQQGRFSITISQPGEYQIAVKHSHTLQNVTEITVCPGENYCELGLLREGDADNNNKVDIVDFSILAASFNRGAGAPSFDERSDFNMDGYVNILDFTLLADSFNNGGEEIQ